jgi:hypothetical protein
MVVTPAYYRRWAARFAQMARRSSDDHTAEELAQIATRLRALAKHSVDQRIKRSYVLERARLTAPARKRSAAQRDARAGSL